MAYDGTRNVVVMFGGYDPGFGLRGDTWEYDGADWSLVTTAASPGARHSHQMIYDSGRGKVVLFGGSTANGMVNDTWEYDGTNWVIVATPASPPVRIEFAMTHDSVRGKTVAFGGKNLGGRLGDTWEYDGVNWTQVSVVGPSVRSGCSMAFDPARGVSVLYGGHGGSTASSDTWEYDGANWNLVSLSSSPGPLFLHAMTYDSGRARVVVYTAGIFGSPFHETWEYDGVSWGLASTIISPPDRITDVVYSDASSRVILFGGYSGASYFNDTWEYGGAFVVPSSTSVYGSGCGSPVMSMSPQANAIVNIGMAAAVGPTPTTACVVAMGWSNSMMPGLGSLPFDLASVGMPGCELLQSNETFGLSTQATSASWVQWGTMVPNNNALLGMHVYTQAFSLAPGLNALQVVASNGIDWGIGNT